MQEALISPVMKTKKKLLRPTADCPPGTKSKKLSRKKRLQNLQRQVYDLEGVLMRTKRTGTTLLPWEEIALAFKEDTLDQVRDNRSLKRQLQRQEYIYHVLHSWVLNMLPPPRTLHSHAETWRHSYLVQGDDDIRRTAQMWIVQHALYNTDRVMSCSTFPDSAETLVEIDVTVDDDEGLFQVRGVVQYTLPLPLDAASNLYWIAENTFSQYRRATPPISIMQNEQLQHDWLRYNRQVVSSPLARQRIHNYSLHGQFRTPDRTTVVWRTIIRDEAFPEEDGRVWTLDSHLWYVRLVEFPVTIPMGVGLSRSLVGPMPRGFGRFTPLGTLKLSEVEW
ncbi:hypothetical protein, variant [Aphanomyces invadans]|uniref:Uncharacterized protein n=1 Tax=Aphanomyces invadans TaxID=157072 RepID=A0A024TU69_9STRA|nr:hypothetical protein, variant [Aphanomyces invadans]ETV97715.1 hypothetical protein, variant [Aphanomyces invadans]|eukprot:XP_008873924.1 hypothetical protein, variant [Aphanomyces invadans]